MKQKVEFDEDKYAERVEKLLEDLKIAEIYHKDTALIIDAIEKAINIYFEYKHLKH